MKETIILQQLIDSLAEVTKTSSETAKAFISEFFTTVAEGLARDGRVTIKGIGTFLVSDLDQSIKFNPDKTLAEEVNAPFAYFESIVLEPETDESQLNAAEEFTTTEEQPTDSIPEPEPEHLPVSVPEPEAEPVLIEESEPEKQPDMTHQEEETKTTVIPEYIPEATERERHIYDREHSDKRERYDDDHYTARRWVNGLSIALATAIGIVIGFILGMYVPEWLSTPRKVTEIEEAVELIKADLDSMKVSPDTIHIQVQEAPAQEVDQNQKTDEPPTPEQPAINNPQQPQQPAQNNNVQTLPANQNNVVNQAGQGYITDIVGKNHFLTTMARKYYNNRYEFWVYIYEENRGRLGHPDHIRPGTAVVIPPLSKYGVDPNDPGSTAAAKRKADEIYARFGGKR